MHTIIKVMLLAIAVTFPLLFALYFVVQLIEKPKLKKKGGLLWK